MFITLNHYGGLMSEPIGEIKRRTIKKEIEQIDLDDKNIDIEKQMGELKGHKIEQINPKNSKTRNLFKKNIQDVQGKSNE